MLGSASTNGDPKTALNPFVSYPQPILPPNKNASQTSALPSWMSTSLMSNWGNFSKPETHPNEANAPARPDPKHLLEQCAALKQQSIQVHYITSAASSMQCLQRLAEPSPPSVCLFSTITYLTLYLNYNEHACVLNSFTMLAQHPNQHYEAVVWDLQRFSAEEDVERCKNHFRAILHTPGILKIVYGVQGLSSLHYGTGLELFDRVLCAQGMLQEWCRLTNEVMKLVPNVPSAKINSELLVPKNIADEFGNDNTKATSNIEFAVLVQACGFSDIFTHTDPLIMNSEVEPLYLSIVNSFLLHKSYTHMVKALAYAQMRYNQLLTYHDFYPAAESTAIPLDPFFLPSSKEAVVEFNTLLCFLCKTLQEKGPMSIPDLSNEVMQVGNLQARQQFSCSGGIKKLVETYPEYLAYHQEISFEEYKLDKAKRVKVIKVFEDVKAPETNGIQAKPNAKDAIDPFLPFGFPVKEETKNFEPAMDFTLQKLCEFY